MISANLQISGWPVTLTWENGQVAGPAGGVAAMQALAESLEGTEISLPSFSGTTANHLQDARSFMALCILISDIHPTFSGDTPGLDPSETPPEGAIL